MKNQQKILCLLQDWNPPAPWPAGFAFLTQQSLASGDGENLRLP
jgi:hypothetical protein